VSKYGHLAFDRLSPDNGSERKFCCSPFGGNARPRQRPDADPGPTRGKLLRSFPMIHLPRARTSLGLQSSRLQSSKETTRFNDDRSKPEHLILSLSSVLLYSLYGIRSRSGELRLALGIMPVPKAETEPNGQAVTYYDKHTGFCSVSQKEPTGPRQAPSYMVSSSMVQAIPAMRMQPHAHHVPQKHWR
jgi:hypothetical protein